MKWKQAMAAMVDGEKVRFIEWHHARWVSAETSDSMGSYTFEELQTMEWEVYKEPTNSDAAVMGIVNDYYSKAHVVMSDIFGSFLEDVVSQIYDEHSAGYEGVIKIFTDTNCLVCQDLDGIYCEAMDKLRKMKTG